MSPSEKRPLRSFVYFLIGLFVFFVVELQEFFIHSGY